ncbi:MAG TPA: DUF6779 domain-containing protein [Mycobacterium sp.]|nr:DUF6779 domain-containing protein [Mycobacterium sp.]
MTDLSRGARVRRGGRRPGWVLLTALLVLAIGASSALVFTNQVKLLKLAVILALWAAVVAAFVSVIYRRQSDVDQARARDLKLVYDLQLDREISARREYELTVESQLRRELSSELRAHSADEVSALRAELAALRTNLEILFDAELSERPALETERRTVRGYSDWDREHESARERVNRVTSVRAEEPRRMDDSSIIDVPEEPLVPPPRQPIADSYQPAAYAYQPAGAHEGSRANRAAEPYEAAEPDRGAHRRPGDRAARAQQDTSTPPTGWAAPGTSPASGAERQPEDRGWAQPQTSEANGWAASSGASPASAGGRHDPQPARRSHRRDEASPQPDPRFVPPPTLPEPPAEQHRPEWPAPAEARRREETPLGWQPVSPEGQWLPPGAPGSNWIAESAENSGTGPWKYGNAPSRDSTPLGSPSVGEPTSVQPPPVDRRARHSSVAEPADQVGESKAGWGEPEQRARSRHSAEDSAYSDSDILGSATPPPAMSPPPPPIPPSPPSPPDREPVMSPPPSPTARHRTTDPLETDAPPSGGQSVAELLARLQASPSGGGGRRRREE